MAEGNSAGNSNGGLYFIVSALVVAVLVIGYFTLGGSLGGSHKTLDIKVETPNK